jgi:hypothetical protein
VIAAESGLGLYVCSCIFLWVTAGRGGARKKGGRPGLTNATCSINTPTSHTGHAGSAHAHVSLDDLQAKAAFSMESTVAS